MRPGPRARPVPVAVPETVPKAPTCPPHLTGAAAEMWHQARGWLVEARTWDPATGPLLERCAVTFARWREAEVKVTELGSVVAAPKTGTNVPNLWLYVARGEADRLLKL